MDNVDNIDDVDSVEKVINISGLCTNCKNEEACDFIKDIRVFITNKKCAEKILDTELTIYCCDKYNEEKDICSENGICLSCKQEV